MSNDENGPALVPIDFEALSSVARRVELEEVLLVSAHFESLHGPAVLMAQDLRPTFRYALEDARWDVAPDDSGIVLILAFAVEATGLPESPDDDEDVELFRFETTWMLKYFVGEGEGKLDEASMTDFCFANGQLNAYPYVRQMVQDWSGKAGWPPLVMPVFRVPASRPEGVVARLEADTDEA